MSATNAVPKPRPAPDHLTTPFWDGCRANELRIQRCLDCGSVRFPPGPVCLQCRSSSHEWMRASGKGRVYSWIVVRHPIPAEIYAADVPYVVALIELEEGVRMPSNIVGCSPEEVTAGMAVEVVFESTPDNITLPRFRPAAGRGEVR